MRLGSVGPSSNAGVLFTQALIATLDKKGKIDKKKPKFVRQDDAVIVRLEVASGAVCLELFKDYAQLGRFTLRDKGVCVYACVYMCMCVYMLSYASLYVCVCVCM